MRGAVGWTRDGVTVDALAVLSASSSAIEPGRRLVWNGADGAVRVWEPVPTAKGALLRNSESIEAWRAAEGGQDGSAMLKQMPTAWSGRLAQQAALRGR